MWGPCQPSIDSYRDLTEITYFFMAPIRDQHTVETQSITRSHFFVRLGPFALRPHQLFPQSLLLRHAGPSYSLTVFLGPLGCSLIVLQDFDFQLPFFLSAVILRTLTFIHVTLQQPAFDLQDCALDLTLTCPLSHSHVTYLLTGASHPLDPGISASPDFPVSSRQANQPPLLPSYPVLPGKNHLTHLMVFFIEL